MTFDLCDKSVYKLGLLCTLANISLLQNSYICLHALKVLAALKKHKKVRLKSLEIKGFKSFADKTTLNFDEGITGVIGPNGCGKSNIVDSIRWVIGEQKISQLRSENLESLVFNGI